MNWKDGLRSLIHENGEIYISELVPFISTEIVEKLIEDIPNWIPRGDGIEVKQQLRDKWL